MTDEQIVGLWFKASHWDITGFERTVSDLRAFAETVAKADRENIAELIERMGIEGYGTLAIAAAVRKGSISDEVVPLAETSSPAKMRRKANSPWTEPGY